MVESLPINQTLLVGGFSQPLWKWWSEVSWDYEIPWNSQIFRIYGTLKFMFQSTNQISSLDVLINMFEWKNGARSNISGMGWAKKWSTRELGWYAVNLEKWGSIPLSSSLISDIYIYICVCALWWYIYIILYTLYYILYCTTLYYNKIYYMLWYDLGLDA